MKVQSFVLCFLLTLLSVSCIREEAPNAEADISVSYTHLTLPTNSRV